MSKQPSDHPSIEVEKALNEIPPSESSRRTVDLLRPAIDALPQVQNGLVSSSDAMNWLEATSRVHSALGAQQALRHSMGLTTDDVRALVAHERGEYYPGYGAVEVHARKQLQSIALPRTRAMSQELLLRTFAQYAITEKLGLERDLEMGKVLRKPISQSSAPWMLADAPLITVNGGARELIDIHLDTPSVRTVHDGITLGYLDLVSKNHHVEIAGRSLARVKLSPGFAETISTLGALGTAESGAVLRDMAKVCAQADSEGVSIEVEPVQPNPRLAHEIKDIGDRYWHTLMQGKDPGFDVRESVDLNASQLQEIQSRQQRVLTSLTLRNVAEKMWKTEKAGLEGYLARYDLGHGQALPLKSIPVRRRSMLDAEGAAEYLKEVNPALPDSRLYDTGYEVDALVDAYVSKSDVPITAFEERGKANRTKVEDVAEQLGISLEPFISEQYTALSPTKTRGPEFEAIQRLIEPQEDAVTAVFEEALTSEELKDPALYNTAPQSAHRNEVTLEDETPAPASTGMGM